MTTPAERTRAVLYTERFLYSLLDPKKTPRVPRQIRADALHLLRHYPNLFDLETCQLGWNSSLVACPFGKVEL